MDSEKKLCRLVDVRKGLGLTQKELSIMLDVAENYISMIESGRKPMSKKLLRKLDSILHPKQENTVKEPPSAYNPEPSRHELLDAITSLGERVATVETLLLKLLSK